MDLEEWDLLADEGFIDIHDKKSIPKKNNNTTVIDMNYFQKFNEPQNSKVIPVPIQIDQKIGEIDIPAEVIKFPIVDHDQTSKSDENNNQNPMMMKKEEEADFEEPVSNVYFKKLKENEFVDMKMDSPKSLNKGILPQIDLGNYQFEKIEKKEDIPFEKEADVFEDGDFEEEGLNVWKWAMTGIGAFFSFGFAAATVSLIVLGNKHKESSKKQDLHFQFYAHDKQLKQVVRHATKLKEAIAVMRGAPVTRAHITIGGYHESL